MHAPVSTFEHKGKQYVLAFSAGSALIGSARGDSVWLFGLDGTLPPVQPGTPVSRTAARRRSADRSGRSCRTRPTRPARPREGKRIFTTNCAVCHGDDGKGGHTGGAPLDKLRDLDAAIADRDQWPQQHAAVSRRVHAGTNPRCECLCR